MTNETTASQPKSIGDDAQFHDLFNAALQEHFVGRGESVDFKRVVAYIDSRAPAAQASATIQAAPEGYVLVPDYRGYANLGTGQYVLNNSDAGEIPELIISIATDEERSGRVVGEKRPNKPGYLIQPESMAVRIRFSSLAGLEVLEGQLRDLRTEHFPADTIQEPVMVAEPVGKVVCRSGDTKEVSWVKGKMPALGTKLYAAPMVADPAGVAVDMRNVISNAIYGYGAMLEDHTGTVDAIAKALAATVKAVPSEALTGAASDVLAERRRQVEKEGRTAALDDSYSRSQLAHAASAYAYPELTAVQGLRVWPWAEAWFKVREPRRNYVRAAALLLAEIERIDRAAPLADKTDGGE